ncbi:hypothetical protein ACJX0J_035871, partial [Zea mays]
PKIIGDSNDAVRYPNTLKLVIWTTKQGETVETRYFYEHMTYGSLRNDCIIVGSLFFLGSVTYLIPEHAVVWSLSSKGDGNLMHFLHLEEEIQHLCQQGQLPIIHIPLNNIIIDLENKRVFKNIKIEQADTFSHQCPWQSSIICSISDIFPIKLYISQRGAQLTNIIVINIWTGV